MKLDLSLSLGKLRRLLTKFLTFNGTTSYGEMVDAWESTDGDWTAEIVFEGVSYINMSLLDSDPLGLARIRVGVDASGFVNFNDSIFTLILDGITLTDGVDTLPNDGKIHTIILTGIGIGNLGTIASHYAISQHYNGIIKSIKLTDNTTPSNSREYQLNSGSTLYELANSTSLGSELVVNGDFSDGLNGWESINSSLSLEDGLLRVSDDGSFSCAYRVIPTNIGETYVFNVKADNFSIDADFDPTWGDTAPDGTTYGQNSFLAEAPTAFVGIFTATANQTYISINSRGAGSIDYSLVSIKQLPSSALIYNNVSASDWDNYYFDRSLGDNGGWVSKTELVVNGGFDTDSGWAKGAGWTIENGVASNSLGTGFLYQAIGGVQNKPLLVSFIIASRTSGNIRVCFGETVNQSDDFNTLGKHNAIGVATNGDTVFFRSVTPFNGSIDSVSVREVYLLP